MTAPTSTAFTVRLPVFSGPLDLLLTLIERNELDISTVSLVAVTDQFLAYLAHHQASLDEVAAYLVVAARLLLIKSLRLLPPPPDTAATELVPAESADPATTLAAQLREYRRFRTVAAVLRARDEAGLHSWPRRVRPAVPLPHPLDLRLTSDGLARLLVEVQRRHATPADAPLPTRPLTVAERLAELRPLLQQQGTTTFAALLSHPAPRNLVVATFLAVLELFRQQQLAIEQPQPFGEIWLRWCGPPAS
ncbi:MAG: segregation/condensation protein A [Chloroflexi bacterium]|nr:segregation/condensation protein A [Chloroflexota bacterium]